MGTKAKGKKCFSVSEISEIYGLDKQTVRAYCRTPWQRFAFQPCKGGKILIDKEKFDRWLNYRATAQAAEAVNG